MNRLKKYASLLLALVMALALAVPAMAYDITINNPNPGHTYEAYQIFTGDLKETTGEGDDAVTTRVLSNIQWGANIPTDVQNEILTKYEAKDVTELAEKWGELSAENATALAEYLESVLSGSPVKTATVAADAQTASYKMTDLAAGYYLIKDANGDLDTNKDTKTSFILQVVADRDVTPKNTDTPVPDKTVKDVNDTDGTENWDHTADHDIGDVIDYQLKATLPETVSSYDTYKLQFNDTLSDGLDMVNLDGTDLSADSVIKDQIVVKVDGKVITDGFTATYVNRVLTVAFADVKAAPVNAGNKAVITVEYKAKLNDAAKIGIEGNENTLTLIYSNNPNHTGNGDDESETRPVIAVVFTFKTVVNKVDENKEPLAGAAFKLEKLVNGTWTLIKEFTLGDNATSFSFDGLDDGRYRLTETETPAGYNTIPVVYFKVEATHSGNGSEKGTLDSLTVYQTDEDGVSLRDEDGNVKDGKTITLEFTTNKDAGSATTDVVNRSGATLPETGGIGTTIFYALGGLLTVGAVVLLVTKKRMSADEK